MKRLYLALLWLKDSRHNLTSEILVCLALGGFSVPSHAITTSCYYVIGSGVGILSEAPISNAQCKALFEGTIAASYTMEGATLVQSSDDEYYCPTTGNWDAFPCGARWYRDYDGPKVVFGGTWEGYWQGIPRNISLTLSRTTLEGGGSESSTVIKSVEPGSDLSYLRLTAIDDNTGLPIDGIVNITADVVANSGGHQHDNNRNTNHSGLITAVAISGFNVTAKTVTTGLGGGIKDFGFTPPAASGDHTITVTCDPGMAPNTCSMWPGPNRVWVGIKGLQPLYDMADYNLIGQTGIHPDNHYLTSEATTKVMDLAYQYHSVSFPLSPVLQLNDASLERGGVFDVDAKERATTGWYVPPHIFHRRGTVIDIRANGDETAIPRKNQDSFRAMMTKLGMTWGEEWLNKPNGHFHVRLLGVEE